MPAAYLNIRNLGVKADGSDEQTAIQNAINTAKSQNLPLYAPAGSYKHSARLILDSVELFGDGDATMFIGTVPTEMALHLIGTKPKLRSVKIMTDYTYDAVNAVLVKGNSTISRVHTPWSAGVWIGWPYDAGMVQYTNGFVVDNVTVMHAANSGIINLGAKGTAAEYARITNNRVEATLSDAIHNTHGTQYVLIEGNTTHGNGDDGIAVVSYGSEQLSSDIMIRNNTVGHNYWGRGITVVGGTRVTIQNNQIAYTEAAGILLYSEVSYHTREVLDVLVKDNTIDHACHCKVSACASKNIAIGACRTGHPAILIGGDQDDGSTILNPSYLNGSRHWVKDIDLLSNTISYPSTKALRINKYSSDVTFDGNTIKSAPANPIDASSEAVNIIQSNTVIQN